MKDEVIVTMPTTSEPEAGFDPAYGWGAVDGTTVEFHMNTLFAVWPYTMAIVGIVPEHAYDETYGQHPIGSGCYIMKQWDGESGITQEGIFHGSGSAISIICIL